MPLYEYECDACGDRFELIRRFSDPPVAACPACGGSVRKLLSSPAIQFKGTGWYVTDYAKKGNGSQAKPDATKTDATAATSGDGAGAKTDAAGDKTSSDSGSSAKTSSSSSGSSKSAGTASE